LVEGSNITVYQNILQALNQNVTAFVFNSSSKKQKEAPSCSPKFTPDKGSLRRRTKSPPVFARVVFCSPLLAGVNFGLLVTVLFLLLKCFERVVAVKEI